jgi:hypothetical protein
MTTLENTTAQEIAECALRFVAANKRAIEAALSAQNAMTDAQVSAADIVLSKCQEQCDAELLRMNDLCSPILAARSES